MVGGRKVPDGFRSGLGGKEMSERNRNSPDSMEVPGEVRSVGGGVNGPDGETHIPYEGGSTSMGSFSDGSSTDFGPWTEV